MGKGDRKTKKGKIAMGTFGVLRPRKSSTASTVSTKKKEKATKKTAKKK